MHVSSAKLTEETRKRILFELAEVFKVNENIIVLHSLEFTMNDDSLNLAEMEKNTLIKALSVSSGNISKAAGLLGVTRRTVYSLIKKYSIGQFLNISEK